MMEIELHIDQLSPDRTARLKHQIAQMSGMRMVRVEQDNCFVQIDDVSLKPKLIRHLRSQGFDVQEVASQTGQTNQTTSVQIDGMTCRSCEILIERKLMNVPGIRKVDVNAATGKATIMSEGVDTLGLDKIRQALAGEKYHVRGYTSSNTDRSRTSGASVEEKPSGWRLIGLFVSVFLLWTLLKDIGLFPQQPGIDSSLTVAAAIILGLVAGSSSCLAVSGGLLLSSAGKFNERYGNRAPGQRMRPVFLFIGGRIISYFILGGMIGLLGKAFTFSPVVTGGITILAALYMLTMGLDMLKIAPQWLKERMPRIPKALSHRIMDAEGNEHWAAPALLGAATFFLPCGFTQSLQVFALTTGDFMRSASILGGFALGTAPALLLLGWASSSLKGKAGKTFFQFSGALVVVLGLWNIQNGLAIAGFPLSFDSTASVSAAPVASTGYRVVKPGENPAPSRQQPSGTIDANGTQVIQLALTNQPPFYSPSSQLTVVAGKPVRLEIAGPSSGCRSVFQIPGLNVQVLLNQNTNIAEFTPTKPGQYVFSCSMGMYRGNLNVIQS